MYKSLLLLVSVLSLAACSVNPSKVDASYAKEFVNKATYVKSNNGICYAIVGTRETMNTSQNGISWTWVPCDQAAPFLEN